MTMTLGPEDSDEDITRHVSCDTLTRAFDSSGLWNTTPVTTTLSVTNNVWFVPLPLRGK